MTSSPESPRGSRPGRRNWALAQGPIEALGEAKNLAAWARDPRCQVTKATLRGRLALGWDAEDAITRGKGEEPPLRYSLFDRALTFSGWSEQSGIPYQTLYARVFTGETVTFKDALLQGPDDPGYHTPLTAFGETKPLHLWALDPRTKCTAARLRARVEANWAPERAITEKPRPRQTAPAGVPSLAMTRRTTDAVIAGIAANQLRVGDTILATSTAPTTGAFLLTVRRPVKTPATAPLMRGVATTSPTSIALQLTTPPARTPGAPLR